MTTAHTSTANNTDTLDVKQLLKTLMAVKQGDFSVRMPVDQTGIAGKIAAMERPVRMPAQFLVAFIVAIGRQEERFGIRGVDEHRQVVRRARFPHRIETAVIDLHQWSTCNLLAQIETKGL